MKPLVIDASVAAKWFFPEEQSQAAAKLLDGKRTLLGPDLLPIEFGNIAWKHFRRELLSAEEVAGILQRFHALPVEIYASESLVPLAVNLAMATGRTVYDSLYLALAIQQDAVFITADARFVNAIQSESKSLAKSVRLLGDRVN